MPEGNFINIGDPVQITYKRKVIGFLSGENIESVRIQSSPDVDAGTYFRNISKEDILTLDSLVPHKTAEATPPPETDQDEVKGKLLQFPSSETPADPA
jgi:hypothetical protein